MKRSASVTVLAAALFFLLSGCGLLPSGDELLTPPRPIGEHSEITEALASVTSGEISLKYPTDGAYESAIISYDLTGSGVNDAVAFYGEEDDDPTSLHMAVVSKDSGEWVACPGVSMLAESVERVEFCDFDGDGKTEIVVGWNVIGDVEREVSVYGFDGVALSQLLHEKQSAFICTDLDTDLNRELLIIEKTQNGLASRARLLRPTGAGDISSCQVDGGVSNYISIGATKLLNGRPAVFLDGQKGKKTITEILYLENGSLKNPLYSDDLAATALTERDSQAASQDINRDGSLDIPLSEIMPGYENSTSSERMYITRWCGFDGSRLVVTLTAVMNYSDGYYLSIPKELQGRITVTRNVETQTRAVYLYDPERKVRGAELFRIRVVSVNNWEAQSENFEGWELLGSTKTQVYIAQKSGYSGENAPSFEDISEHFEIIQGESQ